MAIESLEDQTGSGGDQQIRLAEGERIRTEFSYKYTREDFEARAAAAGLTVHKVWTDPVKLFSVFGVRP